MIDLLVIVPHEDDELAIAGPLIYSATQKRQKVKIVFSTNGDYYPQEAQIRIREAINVAELLGLSGEDVIFLGYGDQIAEDGEFVHMYNSPDDKIVPSFCGKTETYGIEEKAEWAMYKYGVHHTYTRRNLKSDIKDVIVEYMPTVIVTTGWDNHMDHLALSLFVDEILGELLCDKKYQYRPLVLKGLAYNGKWEGTPDYHEGADWTENVNQAIGTKKYYPLHKWEDRIRLLVPKECHTPLLKNNILYKAAKIYKSQSVDFKAIQFINRDLVFWRRPTESLSYRAKIEVSSGDGSFLNDFKCGDCPDISKDYWNLNKGIWVPDEGDNNPKVRILLDISVHLREIHLFENPSPNDNIMNVTIQLFCNNHIIKQCETGELAHDGSRTIIFIENNLLVDRIELVLDQTEGDYAGLTEIELYDQQKAIEEYNLPLKQVENETFTQSGFWGRIEKLWIKFKEYGRNRLWPYKYFLMKRNPKLRENDSVFVFWKEHVMFFLTKIWEKMNRR